jgi:hypothetical protein
MPMASKKHEKPDRSQRSPEYLAIKALEAAELAHVLSAGQRPRAFYHPGYSANVTMQPNGTIERVRVPAGQIADEDAWEAAGRTGAAPWKDAPEPAPEKPFKPGPSKPRGPKSEAFLMIQELEAREREHIAAGNPAHAFYHPGYSANGHFNQSGRFERHETPAGYELDVDAWEAADRQGEAPLREIQAAPEQALIESEAQDG